MKDFFKDFMKACAPLLILFTAIMAANYLIRLGEYLFSLIS